MFYVFLHLWGGYCSYCTVWANKTSNKAKGFSCNNNFTSTSFSRRLNFVQWPFSKLHKIATKAALWGTKLFQRCVSMLQKQGKYCYKHLHSPSGNHEPESDLKRRSSWWPRLMYSSLPKSKLTFLSTSPPNIFSNWKYIHPSTWDLKHRRSRKCM